MAFFDVLVFSGVPCSICSSAKDVSLPATITGNTAALSDTESLCGQSDELLQSFFTPTLSCITVGLGSISLKLLSFFGGAGGIQF